MDILRLFCGCNSTMKKLKEPEGQFGGTLTTPEDAGYFHGYSKEYNG